MSIGEDFSDYTADDPNNYFKFQGPIKVAGAGDINGDGIGDFILGNTPNSISFGFGAVIFGQHKAFAFGELDVMALNGTNGFRLRRQVAMGLGTQVSAAGDVNGDGYDDVMIVTAKDELLFSQPRIFVVFGKASGFPAELDLATLDGSNGFRIDANGSNFIGSARAAAARDFNGDGYDDILIGVTAGTASASSALVFGKAEFEATLDLAGLDGSNGFRIAEATVGDLAGSVAGVGDVNGDGYADLAIGAPGADYNGPDDGSLYLVFGTPETQADVLQLLELDGSTGTRIDGPSGYTQATAAFSAVAAAGDVDGDGYADIVAGASTAVDGAAANCFATACGRAVVLYGQSGAFAASGLSEDSGFIRSTWMTGKLANDKFGTAVAGTGDMNGDGLADVVVTAPSADENGADSGAAYVIFGRAGGLSQIIDLNSLNGGNGFTVIGSGTCCEAVGGGSDLNGDGLGDLILAARLQLRVFLLFGRSPSQAVARGGTAAKQYLCGGVAPDVLWGGSGDVLEGRGSGDLLAGPARATYAHAWAGVVANLAAPVLNTGDARDDIYYGVQDLEGSSYADNLTGNGLANRILGGPGADQMSGGGGLDLLEGGPGPDTETGGAGNDLFVIARATDSPPGAAHDVIVDFNPGTTRSVLDKLDLSAIDANQAVPGNQAFKFIGGKAFTHVAGQLRIVKSGSSVLVQGDTDGDGVADVEVLLRNRPTTTGLTAKDFVL